MNLRISALEKVARIGCKYDLLFLLYSFWALPSGGFAEGQLALSRLALRLSKKVMLDKFLAVCDYSESCLRRSGSSVNLCMSSYDK